MIKTLSIIFSFLLFTSLVDDIVEVGGIKFKVVKKGNSDRKYIWFHGDEKTAKMALDHHMKTNEGTAYYIQNKLREAKATVHGNDFAV